MVCRKEKIGKWLLLFVLVLSSSYMWAQEQTMKDLRIKSKVYDKSINIGLTGGFRSSTYMISNLQIGSNTFNDVQNNYRLGYYLALYARFNSKRHFLHTEVSYNIDRAELTFDKSTTSSARDIALVTSTIYSVGVPLLYGYNVIKSGPYALAVFGGPKLEYIWKSNINYNNFDQQNIQETLHPLNACIVVGVSVNISKVFFDFRYEQELLDISKSITYTQQDDAGTKSTGNILFNRRGSCLSFSFGVLF